MADKMFYDKAISFAVRKKAEKINKRATIRLKFSKLHVRKKHTQLFTWGKKCQKSVNGQIKAH